MRVGLACLVSCRSSQVYPSARVRGSVSKRFPDARPSLQRNSLNKFFRAPVTVKVRASSFYFLGGHVATGKRNERRLVFLLHLYKR